MFLGGFTNFKNFIVTFSVKWLLVPIPIIACFTYFTYTCAVLLLLKDDGEMDANSFGGLLKVVLKLWNWMR